MSNEPNENQMLSDDELIPVSGGTVVAAGGKWTVGASGRPWYNGWEKNQEGSITDVSGSNRPERLADGRTNYWAMGADGKEYLKGTR
ncbi:hypothetical protein [Aquabacter sediminis]|uniref:hypothetical protein n=1 Tax=Aquabacter sediminis TaxID=3029197 RepID=UPI00237E66F3|nr:hypothetical protein [Aquabacter sp. P-9]MDE1568851.1 hypothetical protein [Aquabacter sp. P-9]